MAKGKKKEELTIEEKLEQALVPREEWPYEVPENWCWVRLGNLYEINPKNNVDADIESSFVPMERIEAGLKSDFTYEIKRWNDAKKGHTQFADGDVAFAKISPCFENRKSMIVSGLINGIGAGTTELIVLRQPLVNPQYTFWLISSEAFVAKGKATYSGTVGQQRISMDYVRNYPVPLPPLAEQQRIVNRIESLFSKLDEAKEKAQEALDSFEERKAAILNKAFSGELTKKWREENGISFQSWKKVLSQDVCEPITCGKTPTEYITENGEIPYLKVYNIVDNKIDFVKTPQFIPKDIHEGKLKSSILKPHDVVMNIVGPPLRKIAIIPEKYESWNMNQAIVRFRPKPEIMDYKFLYYSLLNPETLDDVIIQTKGVVGQANISLTQSRNLTFKCPTIDEQREIVRILDDLLSKESALEKSAEQAIESIDIMKKSILAKAFRGELGTNDIKDDNAIRLLYGILENDKC